MITKTEIEELVGRLAPSTPKFKFKDSGDNFYRFKAGKLHFLKITFLEDLQKYRVTLSHFESGVKYSKAQIAEFKKNPVARKLCISSLSWSKKGRVVITQKIDNWSNNTYQSVGLAKFAKHGMGEFLRELYSILNGIKNLGNYICPLAEELGVRPNSKYFQYPDLATMYKKVGIKKDELKKVWMKSSRNPKTLNLLALLLKKKLPEETILRHFNFIDYLCCANSQLLYKHKSFFERIFKDSLSLELEAASWYNAIDYYGYGTMLRKLISSENTFLKRFKYPVEVSSSISLRDQLKNLDRILNDPELKLYTGFINKINGTPENINWPDMFLDHVRPKTNWLADIQNIRPAPYRPRFPGIDRLVERRIV